MTPSAGPHDCTRQKEASEAHLKTFHRTFPSHVPRPQTFIHYIHVSFPTEM
eukprot:jgi/Botrbrau1/23479/Bobra.106_1s0031.1